MKIANQEYKIVDINSVYPHEKNVNEGDVGAIHESVEENDFYGAIIVNRKTNKIIAGKHRWLTAVQQKANKIPVLFIDDIDEERAIKMMLADNRTARIGMDSQEKLLELLADMKLNHPTGIKGTGYNEDDMDQLMMDLKMSYEDTANMLKEKNKDSNNELKLDSIILPNKKDDKLDRATLRVQEEDEDGEAYIQVINQMQNLVKSDDFTQDNEWGILDLDIKYQLSEEDIKNIYLWGTKKIMNSKCVYHFYTDDYRYTSLFQNPEDIIKLAPVAIIEPNFGISNLFPKAVALYRVYQKRWIARNCQKYGIKIAVNLDMPTEFMDINFIGVPKNWESFAANGNILNIDLLYQYKEMAINYTQNENIKYFVYGGGRRVGELCKDNGWIWISNIEDTNKKIRSN